MLSMFNYRFSAVLCIFALTVVVSNKAYGQEGESLAHPDRCIVTEPDSQAAGGMLIDRKNDLGRSPNSNTRNRIRYLRQYASSENPEQASPVPASEMRDVCKTFFSNQSLAVSPDYLVSLNVTPNDPHSNATTLYGLDKIKMQEAWSLSTGSSDVVVGVIDTGVDYTHPDLASNMWVNSGEIPGNGIDDDGNGYIDDVYGWNFHTNTNNPYDDNGHGTHVAGTIGAKGNNGTGVVGVNWNVKIMALKFLNGSGSGYLSNAIKAIDYATENGADLTNNSWGGGGFSQSMFDAVNRAKNEGVLFVAAAGNSGRNADVFPMYPAAYNLPNIISVAATNQNDQLAYFSNYGATSVDIAAPGVSIISTYPGNQYASLSGTSMAAPHVAGAAALLLSVYPHYSYAQLKDAILNNGDYISTLGGKALTSARMNVFRSLSIGATGQIPGTFLSFVLENSGSQANSASDLITPNTPNMLRVSGTDNVTVTMRAGKLNCLLYSGAVNETYSHTLVAKAKHLNWFKQLTFSADNNQHTRTINAKILKTKSLKIAKLKKSLGKKAKSNKKKKNFSRLCKSAGGIQY